MHYHSGVGHLGGNLSCLDVLMALTHNCLPERDYLILSKGHSAGALYIALWSTGVLDDDDLKTFHCDATTLPGHPPVGVVDHIPFATGSLGHGLSLASGVAAGLRLLGQGGRVFCVMSDGEWQEGSTWEALIFASHQKLNNMLILVDHNQLQGFGSTAEVASMSPLWERLTGFNVDYSIVDGHDVNAIEVELMRPQMQLKIIFLKTIKGKGISFLEGKMESHYLPLTREQFNLAMKGFELNEI